MAKDKTSIHFYRMGGEYPLLKLKKNGRSAELLRKVVDEPDEDDFYEEFVEGLEGLKALNKKRALKALAAGKVLNTRRRKFRRWRKHDKRLIKDMLTEHLQSLYESDKISYRRAKRIRKEATSRLLNCFYGKSE